MSENLIKIFRKKFVYSVEFIIQYKEFSRAYNASLCKPWSDLWVDVELGTGRL